MRSIRVLMAALLGIGITTLLTMPTAMAAVTFTSNNSFLEASGGIDDYFSGSTDDYSEYLSITDTSLPVSAFESVGGLVEIEDQFFTTGGATSDSLLSLNISQAGSVVTINGDVSSFADIYPASDQFASASAEAVIDLLFSVDTGYGFAATVSGDNFGGTLLFALTHPGSGGTVFSFEPPSNEITFFGSFTAGDYRLQARALSDDFAFSDMIFSMDLTPSPVPIPAALWLSGSGLLGLIGLSKRKKVS